MTARSRGDSGFRIIIASTRQSGDEVISGAPFVGLRLLLAMAVGAATAERIEFSLWSRESGDPAPFAIA
jgi:hypothetical protein